MSTNRESHHRSTGGRPMSDRSLLEELLQDAITDDLSLDSSRSEIRGKVSDASAALWVAGYRRVDPRNEATVHQVTLVMAEHHRLDPLSPYDRCTCGYSTQLGRFYSEHIACAVLAALGADR